MKFKTKTKMMTATWRDIELAGTQGSITNVDLAHFYSTSSWGKGLVQRTQDNSRLVAAWVVLLLSSVVLAFCAYRFIVALGDSKEETTNYQEPLVTEDGVTA